MRFFPFSSCLGRSLVEQTDIEKNQVMLFLNVYDLTPANNYLYWFGLGFYHSGIEVHGLEYAFGADVEPTSGVFEVEPRSCPDYVFRRSILLGSTDMSRSEVCSFMDLISDQYRGNSYDLIYKNCNHFTNEICHCLTGKHIPGWVNRLARVGCFIDSLLPGNATSFRPFSENQIYPENGSDSGASSTTDESEMEDLDHHVLISPHSNAAFPTDHTPARGSQEHGIRSFVYARPWPFVYSSAEENDLLSCSWAISFSTGVGSTEYLDGGAARKKSAFLSFLVLVYVTVQNLSQSLAHSILYLDQIIFCFS